MMYNRVVSGMSYGASGHTLSTGAAATAAIVAAVPVAMMLYRWYSSRDPYEERARILLAQYNDADVDGERFLEADRTAQAPGTTKLARGRRGCFAAYLARLIKCEYGLKPKTTAQVDFYREKLNHLMSKKMDLRHTDRVLVIERALVLCFIPSNLDIDARRISESQAVKREIEVHNGGWRFFFWRNCQAVAVPDLG